jgi:hypothetical protein
MSLLSQKLPVEHLPIALPIAYCLLLIEIVLPPETVMPLHNITEQHNEYGSDDLRKYCIYVQYFHH